jgi:hypothetical protein
MQPGASMFRVTMREMFWLCTIAALAVGWMIQTRSERTNDQFLQIQLMEQRLHEASELLAQLQSITNNIADTTAKQTQ